MNVVPLRKHKIEEAKLMYEHQLDILGFNETRLSKDICDSDVSVEGFDIQGYDRDTLGGGVAIYVKDTIPQQKKEDMTQI